MARRWTGDRFLGNLDEGEEPPFLDFDGQAAQRLSKEISEKTFEALTSVTKVPYDPTTDFFGRSVEAKHVEGCESSVSARYCGCQ